MQQFLTPFLILIWLGFLACLGLILSAQFARAGFKKRMQQTIAPDEEEVDSLMVEQQKLEMEKSFLSRTLSPIVKKFGAMFKSSARGAAGAQVRDMLEQAGHPMGMHYPEFLGLKLFCMLFFLGVGVVSSIIAVPLLMGMAGIPSDLGTNAMMMGVWALILTYLGFTGPTFWLRKTVNKRIKQIRKSMADVVDLDRVGHRSRTGI